MLLLALARPLFVFLLLTPPAVAAGKTPAPTIKVIPHEIDKRIDVLVDDQPFTSYIWPAALKKPVLYPLRTAKGSVVTRTYPPAPGERTDHPHHVGLWFNYGDVDGVDFWGNSDELAKAEPQRKLGAILHRSVKEAKGGTGAGRLVVTSEWVNPDGKVALAEETAFGFQAASGRRAIDRIATLTAVHADVNFPDTKEGALGLRVSPGFEPDSKGAGVYHSSEGINGNAVWGTRGRWMALNGTAGAEPVTLVILDHPKNPGHPTHWHARGYGLFAANPFGIKDFSKGKEALNFSIPKGKSARLAYRLLILSGQVGPKEIEAEYQTFLREVP